MRPHTLTPRRRTLLVLLVVLASAGLLSVARHAQAVSTAFVASYANPGSARNNFTGELGYKFTTPAQALVVTDLCRMRLAGNSGSHTVKIVRVSDLALMVSASVDVSTGAADAQRCTAVSPVTLAANTSYYIVSAETSGGDAWRNGDTGQITPSVGTYDTTVYYDGAWHPGLNQTDPPYVVPDFRYR